MLFRSYVTQPSISKAIQEIETELNITILDRTNKGVLFIKDGMELLFYAKREYSLIVGEFMILESILIFILGLTYWSVKELDYSMFSAYLILTPTYKLVYVIILMIFILIG